MISGIITSVNATNRTALVRINGKSSAEPRAFPYGKSQSPSVGNSVAIDDVGGSQRIIEVYT